MRRPIFALAAIAGLFLVTSLQAGALQRLPAMNGKASQLQVRVVDYRSGRLTVEIFNYGYAGQTFVPDGLYFVPTGDADSAPQRMGAAGPFAYWDAGAWKKVAGARLLIPGRRRVRIQLEVFCLDKHRSSPRNGQPFVVASKRLPKGLRGQIISQTRSTWHRAGDRSTARSRTQSMIWQTRKKKWIKLQGERKNEGVNQHQRFDRRQRIRKHRIHRYYQR